MSGCVRWWQVNKTVHTNPNQSRSMKKFYTCVRSRVADMLAPPCPICRTLCSLSQRLATMIINFKLLHSCANKDCNIAVVVVLGCDKNVHIFTAVRTSNLIKIVCFESMLPSELIYAWILFLLQYHAPVSQRVTYWIQILIPVAPVTTVIVSESVFQSLLTSFRRA
jgi:hypothetical protein